jgi:hypothetical protein
MNARILITAAMVSALCGVLPANAADPQLLNLVMPDAKVLAGVNVDQAKVTPFGLYILGQMQLQDAHLKELTTLTGFDPTRDVHELLVATTSTVATAGANGGHPTGLAVARGNFDPARINALLQTEAGAKTETYNGVTILEDPKQTVGFAFLNATIVVAGDVENVKAAIDRQNHPTPLPTNVSLQVTAWSASQDAWVVLAVPPSTLHPAAGMPSIPGIGPQGTNNAFSNISGMAGGVKFGANVVVTGQAQAATASDATQMGDAIKLLASLAQMQASGDPNVTALAQSLKVTPNGNLLTVTVSMPQDTLVKILEHPKSAVAPRKVTPKK